MDLRAPDAAAPARPGGPADAIDDIVPAHVVTPASDRALADLLAEAARAGQRTVIRGGGTKIGWGRRPDGVDLVVATAALNRVVAHRYGDLIAIVEAGARLVDVNAELAAHGQWLPIDSPFADATIGGILATNDCGPLRHRFGTPRDQLIGITLATTNGRVVKAGGEVVKNVAGFDLGKLVTGSHGTLAAITSATFKLAPRLMSSQTVRIRCVDGPQAASFIAMVGASQWEPTSVDVHAESHQLWVDLLLRFASTPDAVAAQVRDVVALFGRTASAAVDVLDGEAETALWRAQVGSVWASQDVVVRCGWLPASSDSVFSALREIESVDGVRATLAGRAGVGTGHIRLSGEPQSQLRAIERLRAGRPRIDHVVILRATPMIKQQIDVWGSLGDAGIAMQSLKRAFDPAGIMNAGRGPL
ncbi:MAG: FAD-binding oxidoreductase [Acidobacteriota bacterium]